MPGKASLPDLIRRRESDLKRGELALLSLLDIARVSPRGLPGLWPARTTHPRAGDRGQRHFGRGLRLLVAEQGAGGPAEGLGPRSRGTGAGAAQPLFAGPRGYYVHQFYGRQQGYTSQALDLLWTTVLDKGSSAQIHRSVWRSSPVPVPAVGGRSVMSMPEARPPTRLVIPAWRLGARRPRACAGCVYTCRMDYGHSGVSFSARY